MRDRRPAGQRFWAWVGVGLTLAILASVLPSLLPAGALGGRIAPAPSTAAERLADQTSPQSWVNVGSSGGPIPPVRSAAALAYDPLDSYSLLFGGCGRHTCPLGDTWKFQSGNWSNLTPTLPVAPSARQGSALVYDGADGYLLLFGGVGPGGGALGDSWRFSAGAWAPLSVSGSTPPARGYAQATYDALRGAVILVGGVSATGSALGDTWAYAAGTWTNLTSRLPEAPPARSGGVLAFDPTENFSVLYGGTGACGRYCGDTWALGPSGWANLTSMLVAAPTARVNTTLAFDTGRSALLLFGGYDGAALSDTWAFSDGAWQPLTANLSSSPSARSGAATTYDRGEAYLLLFGGALATGRSSTWVLLSPLEVAVATAGGPVIPGNPVAFTGSIAGGLGPFNTTWQFGDGSAAVAGTVTAHTFARPGTYLVLFTVSDSAGEFASANATLLVQYTPLNVTLQPSPASGSVGTPLSFTAVVSGGAPPYVYAWSAPAGVCTGGRGAGLSCDPTVAGTLQVSVTVNDASGQSASVGLAIPIAASPGGNRATSPTPGAAGPALGGSAVNWPILLPLALLIAVAAGLGLALLFRRRAQARRVERPLCYAVPAWSETPPEFPAEPRGGDAVESWSRVK